MSISTNPPSGNPGSGTPNASPADTVRDIIVEGNIDGNFIVGNNNKIYEGEVNTYYGDVLNYSGEPVVQRHPVNPQPPRPPHGFVGRASELDILEQVIADKETAFIYGHDGLGKTDLVNRIANGELAGNMPDGVVRIESVDGAGHELGFEDVVQRLFDTFFYSMPPLKVDLATAQSYLNNISPLVILDGFDFPAIAFDQFPNLIRNGALLVTHQDLNTDQDIYMPVELTPLARQDAIQLLASKCGVALDTDNEAVMNRICELCGYVPLAITKLAKVIQRKRLDLVDVRDRLESLYPPSNEPVQAAIERSFGIIYSQLSEAERRTLLLVAAAPGISVDRAWLESAAQDSYAVAELEMMELIQANSPRMRLAPGLRQVLYTGQNTWQTQHSILLRYILHEIQSRSLDFDFIADELGNILGLIDWAANENRWNDVITLGRAVDPYLTLNRFWDAWANVLQWVHLAGQSLADKATQAWALHQLGTREIGVGTRDQARDYLIRALRIRQSLGDKVGADYTRHNLNLILPPPGSNDGNGQPDNPLKDFIERWIGRPWRGLIEGYPNISWLIPALAALAIIAVIAIFLFRPPPNHCPMPEGWREYRVQRGDTLDSISQGVALALKGEFSLIRMAILEANFYCEEAAPSSEKEAPVLKPRQILYVPADPVEPPLPPTEVPETPPIPEKSEISLVLSRDPDDSVEVNQAEQVIKYVYDVAHIGKEPITGQLSLNDSQGNEITCPAFNNDRFNPGEIVTCTASYSVTQADLDSLKIVNTAKASIGEIVSNEDTLSLEIAPEFGLEISKKAVPDIYYRVGQEITYTYTIRNSGNVTLGPVQLFVFDDHINGADVGIPCGYVTTIAPGETATCNAAYSITQADIEAGSVTNQANVRVSVAGFALFERPTASTVDIQPATATVTYVHAPELNKTASREEFDEIDQEILYTYTVKNTNEVSIPGPVTVKDYLVSDENTKKELMVECEQVEELAPEQTVNCHANYITTQADLDLGFVTNEATATVGELIPEPAHYTVKAVQKPKLELTKTVNPATYNQVGQTITYTYTIKNAGNITLGPAQFVVTDNHIDNRTPFNCGSDATELARQETLSCSVPYLTSAADLDARSVTNTATASVNIKIGEETREVDSEPASAQVSCPYPPGSPWRIYTILSGDTLSKISSWYPNRTVDDLMQNNCLSSTNLLPGQSLYVPGPPPLATIKGMIFSDSNRNGQMDTQEGEGPVHNATVNLLDYATKVIISSYTTGTNGTYIFTNLKPGVYQIFQAQIVVSQHPGEVLVRDFGIIPVQ